MTPSLHKTLGDIWAPVDIGACFHLPFDSTGFPTSFSVMECPPPDYSTEESKEGNKTVSTLRFSAATNSLNANCNVKTKTVAIEVAETSRTSEPPLELYRLSATDTD